MSDVSSAAPAERDAGVVDSVNRVGAAVLAAPVLLSAMAWAYLALLPPSGVARGVLARGYAMHRPIPTGELSLMDVSGWAASLPWFALMWAVVVVAMMFPVVAPDVVVFDQWRRRHGRSVVTPVAFAAGYLVVWLSSVCSSLQRSWLSMSKSTRHRPQCGWAAPFSLQPGLTN